MDAAGPVDLSTTRLIINPEQSVTPRSVTPAFYAELGAVFGDFSGHTLVATHRFESPWSTWEVHPKGDEVVVLLSGDIDMVLWRGEAEQVVRLSEPGTCVVIPRGIWHTARPHQATEMLFITPGEGTQNKASPSGREP